MSMIVSRLAVTALLVCSAALASCASAPPASVQFDPTSQDGLMVMVIPTTPWVRRYTFRRVDLETGAFSDGVYHVEASGSRGGNRINNDPRIDIRVHDLPPGSYALVEYLLVITNGYMETRRFHCYSGGAPVWEVEPGRVAVMQMLIYPEDLGVPGAIRQAVKLVPDEQILAEIARARTNYTGLIGEAEITYPAAYLDWQQTRRGFWQNLDRNCAEPANFTVINTR